MSQQQIALVDCGSGQEIAATLDSDLLLLRLVEAEERWSPYRFAAIRRFLESGGEVPENVHWNWAIKALQLNQAVHRVCGVEVLGDIQGLMWLQVFGRLARLPPSIGEPLVYVDYLEASPWNTRAFTANPRFKGVGTRLLQAAIRLSQEAGFGGRLGLHTLPQSEAFYSNRCGMQSLGTDSAYGELVYLEFTADAAVAYLNA